MSSMDHLRNKLRASRPDTQELKPAPEEKPAQPAFRRPAPIFTDELPGTADLDASVFQEPTPPQASSSPQPEPTAAKKSLLLGKLQQLEVNRKMLLIAVGIAGVATVLSMTYIKGIAEPLKGQSRLVRVVTLTQDIKAQTPLTESMVQVKEVPAAYVPGGATILEAGKNPPTVLGMLTVTPLYKGEMLMQGRLANPNTSLTSQIPTGHRAITLPTQNAYLMKPGDYVDVIAAINDPNPARRGKVISIPVLQRARILAVGAQFSAESNTNSSGSTPREITVAVPDERVNLMTLLQQQSSNKFNIIQRAADDQRIQRESYTIEEIEDALQGKFEAVTSEPASAEPILAETSTPRSESKKEEDPTTEDISKLVDLSGGGGGGGAPAHRAPARSSYRAPARGSYRAPTRSAPARNTAPARSYQAPARSAPQRPYRAPVVIQGGVTTQSGEQ